MITTEKESKDRIETNTERYKERKENKDHQKVSGMWFGQKLTFPDQKRLNIVQITSFWSPADLYSLC